MSALARTVFIFGIYVVGVGLTMMLAPGVVFQVLGIPTTDEPWAHLAGYLAAVIGFYYIVAARSEAETFCRVTVPLRLVSAVVFVGIASLWGYWPVALFAVPDVAGAMWTWSIGRRAMIVATG